MNSDINAKDYLIIRNSNYIFSIYVKNYKKGEDYTRKRVVQYNLNRLPLEESQKEVAHHKFIFYDQQHACELENHIEIHYLNIEKCKEICYNEGIENVDILTKIGALLTATNEEKINKIIKGGGLMDEETKKEFEKAIKDISENAFIISEFDIEEERRRYETVKKADT